MRARFIAAIPMGKTIEKRMGKELEKSTEKKKKKKSTEYEEEEEEPNETEKSRIGWQWLRRERHIHGVCMPPV